MKDKISIIAPVYNVENYIDRFIKSIIRQTYTNWELILIDDGSTDNSGTICDSYAAKDDRISVFHEKNSGVSTARNIGLSMSTGDYISFVDTDDWLEADMYQCLINSIDTYKSDVSVCDVYHVDENKKKKRNVHCLRNCSNLIYQNDIYKSVFLSTATLWNKLFLKEVVINCRFKPDLSYGEDMVFFLDAIQNIKTISVVKDAKYNYVVNRKGNVVSSKLDSRSVEYLQNGIDVYKRLDELGCFDVGFLKLFYIVNQVVSKIIDQKPKDSDMFISKCQETIRVPSFGKCFRYCIKSSSILLLCKICILKISIPVFIFYTKIKHFFRGLI